MCWAWKVFEKFLNSVFKKVWQPFFLMSSQNGGKVSENDVRYRGKMSACRWGTAPSPPSYNDVTAAIMIGVITSPRPQVPNGHSPDLVISPVQLKDAGFYICRVNCGDALEFSQWAQVDVLNVNMFCGKISQSVFSFRLNHFCDFTYI